jgi:hypothetical protein
MHGVEDKLPNSLQILEHIIIPESQDSVATRFKPSRPLHIAGNRIALRVLSAVHLDDQLGFGAEEVDNVRTDRLLTAKSLVLHLMAPQETP